MPIPRRGFITTAEYYNMYVTDGLLASITLEAVITGLNCLDSKQLLTSTTLN